jgi:D-glycero-D-manno-heptose 1,7-bisphosphate phosphatase
MGINHLSVTAAVFLDRDGVVNELVPDPFSRRPESPLKPEQVALVVGAAAALRSLRSAGYLIVGVSNQPAAAKGVVGIERLKSVHARVLQLLERDGASLDAFRVCFHHPNGIVPELSRTCGCRKPAAGMLLAAAEEFAIDLGASWMVGDADDDVGAGTAAGCRTVLIENPASAHRRVRDTTPDGRAPDLTAAAHLIIDLDRR